MLFIETFVFNPFQENTYVVYDETNECVVIDCACYNSAEEQKLVAFIEHKQLKVVHSICTHGHVDHILGTGVLYDKYTLAPKLHKADKCLQESAEEYGQMFGLSIKELPPFDFSLSENEAIAFGNSRFAVFHIPGHSPGHVVFYNKESHTLFAGDVLFKRSIGRSDLPGGNHELLINGIKNKLLPLPDETIVLSGHGANTTIGSEKKHNIFLK